MDMQDIILHHVRELSDRVERLEKVCRELEADRRAAPVSYPRGSWGAWLSGRSRDDEAPPSPQVWEDVPRGQRRA